jgi:hypothetical protein
MRWIRHAWMGALVALLAGCNGNLAIREITPKTIVLVDALQHDSYLSARGCITMERYGFAPLGDDTPIVESVMHQVKRKLEQDGYRVVLDTFPLDMNVKKYPYGYMIDPALHRYESRWTPEFMQWMGALEQANHAGAIVLVTQYWNSMNGNTGPFYSGFGVAAEINCIGIPPTIGFLYANMGADVFVAPELTRKFFTFDAGRVCDVPLPDADLDKVKAKAFGHDDLRPFAEQIARMGAVQVETELQHANVLRGPADSCALSGAHQ